MKFIPHCTPLQSASWERQVKSRNRVFYAIFSYDCLKTLQAQCLAHLSQRPPLNPVISDQKKSRFTENRYCSVKTTTSHTMQDNQREELEAYKTVRESSGM